MRNAVVWYLLFWVIQLSSQVIITEIMFNPNGSEQTDEFVELYNPSVSESVDLSGWRISDGSGEDAIIQAGAGLLLGPQQYGIILDADYFGQSISYAELIPDGALVLTIDGSTIGSGGLSNSRAEVVSLIDAKGGIVDSIRYDIGIDPGHSYERVDFTGSSAWAMSEHEHGTPGFVNSVAVRQYDLAVVEIRLTVREEQHATALFCQFEVLVHNQGARDAENATVTLYRDMNRDSIPSKDEQIEASLSFSLDTGDSVWFIVPWTMPVFGIQPIMAVIDWPEDQKPENNLCLKTVGIPFPSQSLLINEIMYDPLAGMPEWVEIVNRLDSGIQLAHWSLSDQDTSRRFAVEGDVFMDPDQYCVLAEDSTLSGWVDSSLRMVVFHQWPGFNIAGDAVYLFGPSGEIVDWLYYTSAWGGGRGVSLERIDLQGQSTDSTNWIGCTFLEGMSPGVPNSVRPSSPPGKARLQISPNPFSPDGDGMDEVAVISVNAPATVSRMNLSIFDMRGRKIRDLRKGMMTGTGATIVWDGNDNAGRRARIGLYIVMLEALDSDRGVLFREKTTVVLTTTL